MPSQNNTVSGIDINSVNICYARCNLEERTISSVSVQPLEVDPEDYWQSVTAGFDQLFKQLKLPGENIISSLPGEYAIIKKIILDKDEEDVEGAIDWELSQQIVGSIDEYVYDYQSIVGNGEDTFQHYLVVGYRTTAIDRVTKLLKGKKFHPLVIDLDIFALINLFEMNYPELISDPALIIFSELSRTKLILTCNGSFTDLEIFDHPNEDVTPVDFMNNLDKAIEKLVVCNKEYSDKAPFKTFLTGSNFFQSDITDMLLEKIEGSEILMPFRKISCSAAMDEEKLKSFSTQLCVAVGLALRDSELGLV